jgi:hypothetical protein
MMKPLYKSTKVIYDAHHKQYEVYYRNWFFWKYDCAYKFDEMENRHSPRHYCTREEAEKRAIRRASDMLKSTLVWKQSNFTFTE